PRRPQGRRHMIPTNGAFVATYPTTAPFVGRESGSSIMLDPVGPGVRRFGLVGPAAGGRPQDRAADGAPIGWPPSTGTPGCVPDAPMEARRLDQVAVMGVR